MSSIIQIKNTPISGSIPSNLTQGELAINVTDGRLFYGSGSSNVVKEFIVSGSGGTINTSSLLSIASFNAYTGSNTSQFAGTASYVITSSYALVAQNVLGSITSASYAATASYILQAVSASYALTSSYSQNLQISGSINNVDYIDFNTSASVIQPIPGRLSWNDTDGTLDIGLKGGNVTIQIGQEEVIRVVNKTGGNLLEADYRVVRVRSVAEGGAQGQRLAVVLAQADNDANSATTLGLVTEDIIVNQEGFITLSGQVRKINTTGTLQGETWVDGDMLYLSPTTPGYLTNIKPQAPQHTVIVGYVEYAHINQGKIFVKVDNGYEIDELHNVRIDTGSLTSGQLLVRSGSLWINSNQLTGSYGLTGSLNITGSTTLNGNLNTNLTTGSVPFISSSGLLTQDNSNLFWDNTNKRLGIGLNTPSYTFHAKRDQNTSTELAIENTTVGSLAASIFRFITNASFGSIGMNSSADSGVGSNRLYLYSGPSSNGIAIRASQSGQNIRLYSGGDTSANLRLSIESNGNVLIGTGTDSGFKFDVSGSTRLNGNTIITGSLTSTATTLLNTLSGNTAIGLSTDTSTARLQVRGTGNTSATNTLLLQNSSLTNLLTVRDDGSTTLSGSLSVTQGITGSLFGTASLAQASELVVITDNPTYGGITFYPTFTGGTGAQSLQVDSSTFTYNPSTNILNTTSSRAISSSYALTASWAPLNVGGSNTQIQFNSGSALAGTGSFTFNYLSQSLQQGSEVKALGIYSHAEGQGTQAIGASSHAEGLNTVALGSNSHAEGNTTIASGRRSHSEGQQTLASGETSHAEGYFTTSSGDYSHAEGSTTISSGLYSHAEGSSTQAIGESSHAEGASTIASGQYSHAEGNGTQAVSDGSHAEGEATEANGKYSHAEGLAAKANGNYSHAEGDTTTTDGTYSHAEGSNTLASGEGSHAEGEGGTEASGSWSHAEGRGTKSLGRSSHAEGSTTQAIGDYSHAEGASTEAIGESSHAEGNTTQALGNNSHAEGVGTNAVGDGSHAEGRNTQTIGEYSHVEGHQTISSGIYQHVQGQFNLTSSIEAAFIIGNGIDDTNRSNLVFAAGNTFQVTGSVIATQGFTGSLFGTSSFAVSASWAPGGTPITVKDEGSNLTTALASLDFVGAGVVATNVGDAVTVTIAGGGGSAFPFTGSAIITGSLTVTGSLNVSQGITGSLFGTSSWAQNAVSASNIVVLNDPSTAAEYYPILSPTSTGTINARIDVNNLRYNPSTNTLTAGDLTLAAGGGRTLTMEAQGAGGTEIKLLPNSTAGYARINVGNTNQPLDFQMNSNDVMRIAQDGKVGIGTTGAAAKLEVRGTGNTTSTTALLLQNSSLSNLFKVTDGGDVSQGAFTTANGGFSHAEGFSTTANGSYSHAEGFGTIASGSYQHVQGQYNITSSAQSAFIIGNGADNLNRSNLVFASGSEFQITGSLRVSGSITGSLFGTASYATLALNVVNGGSIDTGSLVTTASFNAFTSSYNTGSFTGSFIGNGSQLTGVVASAAPGGGDKDIQFNDSGATSGSANFQFDKTTNSVFLTGSLFITGSNTAPVQYIWLGTTQGANGTIWTNMPAATASFGNATGVAVSSSLYIGDFTTSTQCRLFTASTVVAFAATTALLVQYSTDNITWTALTPQLTIGNTLGIKDTGWAALPAGAKNFVYIRLVGYGGNGTVDPAMSPPILIVR